MVLSILSDNRRHIDKVIVPFCDCLPSRGFPKVKLQTECFWHITERLRLWIYQGRLTWRWSFRKEPLTHDSKLWESTRTSKAVPCTIQYSKHDRCYLSSCSHKCPTLCLSPPNEPCFLTSMWFPLWFMTVRLEETSQNWIMYVPPLTKSSLLSLGGE